MVVTVEKPAIAPVQEYIILELAYYKRYTRGVTGTPYEADKAYRFKAEQAAILLEEVEEPSGRPIWRRYKPKTNPQRIKVPEGHKQTMDAASDIIKPLESPDTAITKGIQIGSDDEIKEILGSAEEGVAIDVA
jgi:hypothetical protein